MSAAMKKEKVSKKAQKEQVKEPEPIMEPAVVSDNEEDHDDERISYDRIEVLQDAGINATDIAKLKEDGFATVGQLFQVSMKRLLQVKGVSEAKAEKLIQAGRKIIGERSGFISASALLLNNKQKYYITTGSKQFDALLGGGIETMSVTEVHGEFRTGKTQLCHTVQNATVQGKGIMRTKLCVTAQLPRSQGGGAGKVAIVDTEGSFRPQRVAEIAKTRYDLNPKDVLDNIIVARAHSHDAQMDMVTKLGVLFADPDRGPFRLLIIDSITALFRTDFSGRSHSRTEFNVAVLVVNQVMADPGANAMFGPVLKPVGGHVISHACHTRVLMKKGRGDNRICKIIDSPCMPEAECSIQLCPGGISDADD
ncbi:RecA family ATPase Dmc1 [Achlya hypogyna]|uniref:RecA family ATPase Dmc1 n=1 Tax=Achlya hypogyna TaxID=1202772 RepID=A0A1V9ZMJ1_ACHHY|nr:RecA family ATPase Dmc1 [Achlya hypogyna]